MRHNYLEEVHQYCIDVEGRSLYLHGHISHTDEDPGTEYRMANNLLKNILFLDKKPETITIHQHNVGGQWESGMMIFDAINNCESHINIVCHGETMSMGTIILQAADTRYSMEHCSFLFHYGEDNIESQYLGVQSFAEVSKKYKNIMLDIYTNRCNTGEYFKGKSRKQIRAFLDRKFKDKVDWYLTAEEAKYYGFLDKIIPKDCELKNLQ